MPRARNLKPGFFTNDKLGELPPLTRLLFAGLWTIADRLGRLEDRPKKIKAEVLPYDDNCKTDGMLQALHEHGFILRYAVNGTGYIQVLEFLKHQNPHVKEIASTIPAPGSSCASTVHTPYQTPDKPDACTDIGTVLAPEIPERARLIPDSLLLIPESIENLTPLSDSPEKAPATSDDAHPKTGNGKAPPAKVRQDAIEVLTFLNDRTEHHYRQTDMTLKPIIARLKEGYSLRECRAVIARKRREWQGTEFEKFLRPETLFGATKFAQYVGEVPPETTESSDGQPALS